MCRSESPEGEPEREATSLCQRGTGRPPGGEEGARQELRGRKSRRDASGPREDSGISTAPSNGVASWDDKGSRGVRAATLVASQASHRRQSPKLPAPIGFEIIMCIHYTE